jgi:hypothetical protein
MTRIVDALTAIGATVLVLVLGWLILYPQRRKRDEWVQTERGKWRRGK